MSFYAGELKFSLWFQQQPRLSKAHGLGFSSTVRYTSIVRWAGTILQLQLKNWAINEKSNRVSFDILGKLTVSQARFASSVTPQGNSQKTYIFFPWQMSQIKDSERKMVEAPRVWYFKRVLLPSLALAGQIVHGSLRENLCRSIVSH